MNQGFLSREEVGKVLDNQVDSVQAFGRMAVELGFLSVNQVNSLLVLQRRSKGGIGSLVALGHVSQEDMDRFFAEATQKPQAAPNLTIVLMARHF